jgi:hypothetical protein
VGCRCNLAFGPLYLPNMDTRAECALAEAIGGAELVTKSDMHVALRDLEQRLTIKFGSMLIVAAVGVILAALRFLPAAHPQA